MLLSKLKYLIGALALCCLLSFGITSSALASPAHTTENSQQPISTEQAKEQAAEKAAESICKPLAKIKGISSGCKGAAETVFKKIPNPTVNDFCEAITIRGILKGTCIKLVGPVVGAAQNVYKSTYDLLVKPVVEVVKTAEAVAEFAANPTDAFERLGNKVKETAVSLTQEVFSQAAKHTNASFSYVWFRKQYASAAGLGVLVLVVLLFIQAVQVAGGRISPQDFAHSVFIAAPTGILLMIFAPALGAILSQLVDALSESVGQLTGVEVGKFATTPTWLMAAGVSHPALRGGLLVGIAVFTLMAIGSFAALVGMVLQEYGVYVVAVGLAIAWGMWVHPAWRAKTRKLVSFLLALMLMKPLFILLIGVSFAFLNSLAAPSSDPFEVLFALVTIAVVLVVTGFAPWVLLKYAPILPGGNEWHQSGGGSTLAVSAVALDRSLSQSRFGGHGARTAHADMTTSPAGVGPQDGIKGGGASAAKSGGMVSAGAAAAPPTLGASLAAALAAEAAKAGVSKARQVAGDADETAREAEGAKA